MWEAIVAFVTSDVALQFFYAALIFVGGLLGERHLAIGDYVLKLAAFLLPFIRKTQPPQQ